MDARTGAQYVIIMKKKILLSSILVFFSLTCIVVFSTIAIKEKARKEAMENKFFRNLKIFWNDETESSKGKIIEIPFHIYVSSMGDEEFYIRRLKIGKTKSVRLKMGHYKLSPGFSYDSPMGYSITIEPTNNWFSRKDDFIIITIHKI